MAEGGRFHKVFHTPPTLFYKTQHIHCLMEWISVKQINLRATEE
jgi:hypothetical protein